MKKSHAARKSSPVTFNLTAQIAQRLWEAGAIALLAFSLFLVVALISYQPADPGWTKASGAENVFNSSGKIGAWIADVSFYFFGQLSYLFPFVLLALSWLVWTQKIKQALAGHVHLIVWSAGFIFVLSAGTGLLWVRAASGGDVSVYHAGGGVLGDVIGRGAFTFFGEVGGSLVLIAVFFAGLTLCTNVSWLSVMDLTGRYTLFIWASLKSQFSRSIDYWQGWKARRVRISSVRLEAERNEKRLPPKIELQPPLEPESDRVEQEKQEALFLPSTPDTLPELSLLDPSPPDSGGYSAEALEAMSRQVEMKLKDFSIEVEVVAVKPGPVITRFELEPAPGIKASRITNLAKDLARSLSTISVRVVEVIPGKTCIGLEIPNERRELVTLGDILKSRTYESSNSDLTMALGKDIGGQPVVADLARMPHLLVAGTTGSGKSVALNAMVLSLLYKSTAEDVRLIMIDPKMLELSVYEGIPSLLAPVVTDMKEASNALRWCVAEMERRYRLMAALGVRNIGGYNRKVKEAGQSGEIIPDPLFVSLEPEESPPPLETLPYIVVIVDELADMMMVVGKKVEELIARLAQKARAAGIHLILATQRPSVDVITGLIKANIPSRIAFQVSSRVDSRTILDQMGAETLLGHGDMLYLPPGTVLPTRVHGAFVSDEEVHKVVQRLKKAGSPEYIEDVVRGPSDSLDNLGTTDWEESETDQDQLYDAAVKIVTESRRASVSGIQRRLKVGYNRAARMVEEMEKAGVVGELQSNGSREVLAPPPPKD